MKKHKHLTLEDRLIIEKGINSKKSCKEISEYIEKSESTIRREILTNRYKVIPNKHNNFSPMTCICSFEFPYVCNNCIPDRLIKKSYRYFYNASIAQESYEKRNTESKSKSHYNEEEIQYIDQKIKEGLNNKQPLNHILISNNLPISISTAYRWIREGKLSVKTIDLQKAVRYRVQDKSKGKRNAPNKARKGRTYEDYLDLISNNPDLNMVEMDIVEGIRSDKKCILTFVCIKSNLLFSRLLKSQNSFNVIDALNTLELKLGLETFKQFFGAILTDNGVEFNNAKSIEYSPFTGEQRTRLFYCDPNRSDQKGTIERKHVDMRLMIPKKTSIEFLTQEKVDLMNSNINGVLRPTLNNQSTYSFSIFLHNEKLINLLGIYFIEPSKINLSPNYSNNIIIK